MMLRDRCRIAVSPFLIWTIFEVISSLPRISLSEKDSVYTHCTRGHPERTELVSAGGQGNITSFGYPDSYSVRLYQGALCQIVFTSCDKCKFHLRIAELRLPPCNRDPRVAGSNHGLCFPGCDYLFLEDADPPYSNNTRRFYLYQDRGLGFMSISKSVRLVHCMSNRTLPGGKLFRIQYQVVDKQEIYRGTAFSGPSSSGILMSPNFPHGYSLMGEIFTYIMENRSRKGKGGVRIVFDDWDIAADSLVEIYDGMMRNKSEAIILDRLTRPVYNSRTSRVYLVFHTGSNLYGCCTNIGFKATYTFSADRSWPEKPSTDCSSTRAMSGGGIITFRGSSLYVPHYYDCVWIIKRFDNGQPDGALLQLRVVEPGKGMTQHRKNVLVVHQGITSMSPVLAAYHQHNIRQDVSWFTTGSGFYARLQGTFYSTDSITFIFTAVHNVTDGSCPVRHFLCQNDICIHEELLCDEVDHCGDNSDESPAQQCSTSTVPATTSPSCPNGFICVSDLSCLPTAKRCDRAIDCTDSSDENHCDTSDTLSTTTWSKRANSRKIVITLLALSIMVNH